MIFYLDDDQKRVAFDIVAEIDASGRWPGPVATEVTPAGVFWEAEPEHQDYLQRNPGGYTCHWVRPEWILDPEADPETASDSGSDVSAASATASHHD